MSELLQLAGIVLAAVGGGVGVYTGIRADLAGMKATVEDAHEAARSAHRRIDDFLLRREP